MHQKMVQKFDEEMWVTFHELHVEPLFKHTDTVWVVPVPIRLRDEALKVGEFADRGRVEASGAAEGCRHPFGLLNPSQKVWEAHKRLALGGGSEDQELVDVYAVGNACYGMVLESKRVRQRHFKVRRPHYSPSLAKQRRIEKDLEAR